MPSTTAARPGRVPVQAAATAPESRPLRPLLLALFVASGCSALIYEIVWFQMLQLVIGSSAISLGVLLGTFMGGMCLGSLGLSRFVSSAQHPLRVYAKLEAGIGLFGLLVLLFIPYVNHVYVASVGHGMPSILLRSVVAALCLLPPTLLMGATLPAIARYVQSTREGVSWMGLFYGGNIAGAVFGCLLAGFYLLRVHDMSVATYVAAVINFAVATASFLTSRFTRSGNAKADESLDSRATPARGAVLVYVVIGLSGFTGLGAEVVWTRLLSLLFGGSVYTFSIILAVFLVGLGIGSSAGSFAARTIRSPRVALGFCQLLLAAAIFWTAYMLTDSVPFWPINPGLSSSIWFNFQLDVMRCMWAILPPTLLWGASFPLALAATATRDQDPGRLVGGVYAANTLGAILGAVSFSVIFMPSMGSQGSQRVLIAVAAFAGVLALAPVLFWTGRREGEAKLTAPGRVGWAVALVIGALVAPLLMSHVDPVPWRLVAWGRNLMINSDKDILYVGEGMNSSVAVTGQLEGTRYFHVAGKVEASSEPQDMRLQRMLGHIPALLHPAPKRVLVVGCGAGVTAGSFLIHPEFEHETICEIEPLIPRVVSTYFSAENNNVVNDPRVSKVFDDARHYVLTTDQTFDIITSDPINPWVKGAATLYTKEYFEMCKRHLAPGGMVTQWVPLYESNAAAVKSQIATFFEVFPNGTIWSNDEKGRGYDLVLLGQVEPLKIDVDALAAKFNDAAHASVRRSVREVGFPSVVDLMGRYAGRAGDLQTWLADAQINRDRNLRLQYLAGMDLNSYHEADIYYDIAKWRKFPEDLFAGTAETRLMVKHAIEQGKAVE